MPRWIYNRPPEKCQSSEILFAQTLNELLPDAWIVRWGYWYEDEKGTLREGDFLVLGPHGGLAVLEVKSSLSYQAANGRWNTADGDNPLTQLMTQHAGVLRRIQSTGGGRQIPYVTKSLVLPLLQIAPNITEFRMAFQSAPPVKAATSRHNRAKPNRGVSIRAAREGGDAIASRNASSV